MDEWEDYSETDWLRTTDATRKEKKDLEGEVRCNNEEGY